MLITLEAITPSIIEAHIMMSCSSDTARITVKTDAITARHIVDPIVLQSGSNRMPCINLNTRIIAFVMIIINSIELPK